MAADARIVLFSWVWNPLTASPEQLPFPAVAPLRRPLDTEYVSQSRRPLGLVGWRVIGANNRELGRSVGPTGSVEQAHQAVIQAQLNFDRAEAQVTRSSGSGWLWRVSLDGEQVVVSSRLYHRQRECSYNFGAFSESFAAAQVVTSGKQRFRPLRPVTHQEDYPARTQPRLYGGQTQRQDRQRIDVVSAPALGTQMLRAPKSISATPPRSPTVASPNIVQLTELGAPQGGPERAAVPGRATNVAALEPPLAQHGITA